MKQEEINLPVAKAASAIAAAGITWSEIASILAALYTVMLISEWVWKRLARPFAERRGWIKINRRVYTAREWSDRIAAEESESAPL